MIKNGLNDYSWEEITFRTAKGIAEECFKIGDEKKIVLQNGEQLVVQIYDFNHDMRERKQIKAGITFGLKYLLPQERVMNSNETAARGWETSDMRRWLNEELFFQLPEDLQKEIVMVEKRTAGGENGQEIVTTVDRLFLFSEIEVFGKNHHSHFGEGSQYPIFQNTRARCFNGGDTYPYSTRSIGPYDTYATVLSDGSNDYGNTSMGVVFGFCVGINETTQSKISLEDAVQMDLFTKTIETVTQTIQQVHKRMLDQSHRDQLETMNVFIERIKDYVLNNPGYLNKNRRLINYYLPTTLELMETYLRYKSDNQPGKNSGKIVGEIEESFELLNTAYGTMIDGFYAQEYLEVATDLSVLKTITIDDKWEL